MGNDLIKVSPIHLPRGNAIGIFTLTSREENLCFIIGYGCRCPYARCVQQFCCCQIYITIHTDDKCKQKLRHHAAPARRQRFGFRQNMTPLAFRYPIWRTSLSICAMLISRPCGPYMIRVSQNSCATGPLPWKLSRIPFALCSVMLHEVHCLYVVASRDALLTLPAYIIDSLCRCLQIKKRTV